MAEKSPLQLFTHPVSPFCRRATYALSFKSVVYEAIETDLLHPSEDFKAVSFTGEVPAARIQKDGRDFAIVDSLRIVEYVDLEFSGPPLYVRALDGTIDWMKKALLDQAIKKYVDPLVGLIGACTKPGAGVKEASDLQKALQQLNDEALKGGRHFLHESLGVDMVSVGDIALLPLIETIDALRDQSFREVLSVDLSNLWTWYRRLSEQPWATRNFPGLRVIRKYVELATSGVYPKLTLPVTLYF